MLKRLFSRSPKSYQVEVEPFGTTFTVGAKETLLRGALRAGLAYPYECQTGACSTCKTQVVAGETKALVDFAYTLEMEEIHGGTILACQTLAKSDLKIRVDTLDDGLPAHSARKVTGTISRVINATRDILDVQISLTDGLGFYAGQYVNLWVPGVPDSRSYSFASAPGDGPSKLLNFHIRLVPDGEVSGWFAAADRVGETVELEGPHGVFRLRSASGPIVCIAGGSGMAPIKAMLEQASGNDVTRPLVYLYGGRTQADLYPQAMLDALAAHWTAPLRYVPVLSEEPQNSDWIGARGFVTDYIATINDFELAGAQAYLCGPPPMIDAALPLLANAGVRGRDIYFDKFSDRSTSGSN